MKSTKLGLVAAGMAVISILGFRALDSGTVKGKVTPADAAVTVWLISATDTLKAPVDQGSFSVNDVKPGTYKLVVEAKPPYKNAAKEGVTVADGQPSDVGEIKLSQ